jgi:hypothetical protein
MDSESGEESAILKLGAGLALVALCMGIGFRFVLTSSLTRIDRSIDGAFLVTDNVDSILDSLDRLSLNQRFFIRTGDSRFSQDVYESVTVIERQMDSLRQVAHHGSRLRGSIAGLNRALDCVLATLRRCNEVEKSHSSAAALALLDQDESIVEAEQRARQLRMLAIEGVFDRVRSEGTIKSIIDGFI